MEDGAGPSWSRRPAADLPQDYSKVWRTLRDPTLHRPHRIVCWRILHGQLGCNAFLFHTLRRGSALCCNPACAAAGSVETLTHAFLECPAARPAVEWLCDTWAALTGGPRPPCTAATLLADDPRDAWLSGDPPEGPFWTLWSRVRVAVIGSIWQVRCFRSEGDPGDSVARRAVREAVNTIVSAIHRDWARTQEGGVRHLDSGVFCQNWWRGMDASMDTRAFEAMWTSPPILCEIAQGQLSLKLSLNGPIALPP